MDETLSMLSANPQAASALNILVKLCLNIITNPEDKKYRRLNLANPTLSTKLFSIPGASDVLKLLGFMADPTDPTFLLLPEGLELPADLVGRLQTLEAAIGPPPPAPALASPPPPAPSFGLSEEERAKRAADQVKKRLEGEKEKARILEMARLDQEERIARAPKVVASVATKVGTGEIKKFEAPSGDGPGS